MDTRPLARGKQLAGLAVGAVVALALPAASHSTVRCVPLSNTTGCAQSYTKIQDAVSASSTTGDTVRIAGGPSYNEHVDATAKTITFIGAGAGPADGAPGPGDTVIATATTGTALNLPNGGTVQSLRVVGSTPPSGNGSTAIGFPSAGDFTLNLAGVVARGGDGEGGSSSGAAGLLVTNGDDATKDTRVVATNSTLTGGVGFGGGDGASFGAAGGTATLSATDTLGGNGFSPGFGLFASKGGNVTQTGSASN